ncbi:hypothetical protein GUITHDRAFT_99034 [Guillardia theta CCMP2712]|uniref:Glycosyltransferase 2-like domain-containing protein n=3 Tax=Guillardia theta TaxID=55529 RepID=L1K356_GUITC|nr:hypothetical protein GUITHDRAFT_99034 [Guillardia theta CCMP2712]EKX55251.1 hypothetical protein GUITHDRAFT_99034 [Guillardia theta CCMP2712]|eukprot:XP_005842231.1 hypothetical protein GUITHDRAFT_99034 [Guillardia theta CCMP2712]
MGTNSAGYANTGPLKPMIYPDSVSIVVPCYNCGEFVIHAFESFERSFELLHMLVASLGLNRVSCEVVVVDDFSTDNSVEVISRFLDPSGVWNARACSECLAPPPRYTLVRHERNRGAGVTRNDGVAAARGSIILFGEADDVFYEHHVPTCWDLLRRHTNLAFVKLRMDAGKEYFESSFVAHQAPIQELHPHWQIAIEDTSPMNICIRKEAHDFIGGYPDGELFHMDMEDGAYMMCLYEAYAGVKWLSSPSTLYVRRPGNGLDRRMLQFTHEPGAVQMSEQDAKYGDARFDLIDGQLAAVRDQLVEYQAVEELLVLDALSKEGIQLHEERAARFFGHAYGILSPSYPPQPIVALLFRGCRPRRLHALLARLLYVTEVNPFNVFIFIDDIDRKSCHDQKKTARLFPVHTYTFPSELSRRNMSVRAYYAVETIIASKGGSITQFPGIALLLELEQEAQNSTIQLYTPVCKRVGNHLVHYNASDVAGMQPTEEHTFPQEYAYFWQRDKPLSSTLELMDEKSLRHAKICRSIVPSRISADSSRHDAQAIGCCVVRAA